MSRLIESIRLCDGVFSRLELHQLRVDKAFDQIYRTKTALSLQQLLKSQEIPSKGLYKCRVVYDEKSAVVKFAPYQAKSINSLKLLVADDIDYSFKWEDRSQLNNLFAMRGMCDDVLIVKNRFITDTSYANILFEKNGQWFTPQSHLLAGTMRQYLLNHGVIEMRGITVDNFREYNRFKLINAMLGFESPAVDVSNIY